MRIQLLNIEPAGEYEWKWPSKNVEHFHRTWVGRIAVKGQISDFRHGIGERHVYGRCRVHSVSWIATAPLVEGVEADDYGQSNSLLSVLRLSNKRHVKSEADLPDIYKNFHVVSWRSEIDAPRVPHSLAVKIREDDVAAWATHAAIRATTFERL
ncbi:hypothetical protein [Methyloceanibacter sp.]|uniref:hypothetical protein n=1 Tax=Methyloceanibacter sp. TaxID=1965321 RepID=UPI003D6CBDE6